MMPKSKAWISGTWTSRGFHVICISPDCAVAGQSKITWQAMKIVGRGLGVQSNLIHLDPASHFWGGCFCTYMTLCGLVLVDVLKKFGQVVAMRKTFAFLAVGPTAGTQADEWYSHKQPEWKIQPTRRLVVFCGGQGNKPGRLDNGSWEMSNWETSDWLIDWLCNSIFMYILYIIIILNKCELDTHIYYIYMYIVYIYMHILRSCIMSYERSCELDICELVKLTWQLHHRHHHHRVKK